MSARDVRQYVRVLDAIAPNGESVHGVVISDALTGAEITLPAVTENEAWNLYYMLIDKFGCYGRAA